MHVLPINLPGFLSFELKGAGQMIYLSASSLQRLSSSNTWLDHSTLVGWVVEPLNQALSFWCVALIENWDHVFNIWLWHSTLTVLFLPLLELGSFLTVPCTYGGLSSCDQRTTWALVGWVPTWPWFWVLFHNFLLLSAMMESSAG